MGAPQSPIPDLDTLIGLFYENPDELGVFAEVEAGELPQPYKELLDHNAHMTVTVEEFHGGPVDVQVLQTRQVDNRYARKILLTRQSDRRVVQFGIVRLSFDVLSDDVRREIISQQTPLGRVLIEHNVLREVELASLWRVEPGEDLRKLFGLEKMADCYGRTALIYVGGEPAVELLEIVTPA